MVVLVRLVKLMAVLGAHTIKINHISEIEIKRRGGFMGRKGVGNLLVHGVGDGFLDVVAMDAAGVSDGMKDEHTIVFRGLCLIVKDPVPRQAQVVETGCRSRNESRI